MVYCPKEKFRGNLQQSAKNIIRNIHYPECMESYMCPKMISVALKSILTSINHNKADKVTVT